jgi:Flp pilus assembly protein TadG
MRRQAQPQARRWASAVFRMWRDDRGAASVEMAGLVWPAVVLGLSLIAGVWVVTTANLDVHAAAASAARAASQQPTPDTAAAAAQQAAAADLAANQRTCSDLSVTTDTSTFFRGGTVSVTVRCSTDLAGLGPSVLHGPTYSSTARSPLDLYGQVGISGPVAS